MQEEESVGDLGAMDVETLTSTIKSFVIDKRYLIVIDDVWTIAAWDAIQCRLPENNHSSRIIVTTRMETVAKACSPASISEDNICRIQHLGPQDSEKIFLNRVFGANNACPEELKEVKNNILKKCGGLPLAIISMASLLANNKSPGSVDMWNRVWNSIGSQMEINPTLEGMRQIITLSYNHLPYHLKACFIWIAEGLVPEKRGLTSLEVAEAYFDELLSRNMVKPGSVDYNGVTECCVHDMMLEVILSKALEENFISLVGGPCRGLSYDNIRRLSIHGYDQRAGIEGMSMQHVRSLSTFCPEGQFKLLDRLKEFTLLRVLDLEGCKDVKNHHMEQVCRLFLLRFLSLRRTDVTEIPCEIEKLRHLQRLDLRETLLGDAPQSLINLEKLEILDLSNRNNWRVLLKLPKGLRKMKALQRLDRFELGDDPEVAKEIGELVRLRHLGIVLIHSTEQVRESLAHSIGKITSLHSMTIENIGGSNMNFVEGLNSPPQILRLHGDQIFGVLCKLPNLVKLSLDKYSYTDEQLCARTEFKFPVLKMLFLVPDYGTPKVVRFEKEAMARLEKLTMRYSREDRSLQGLEHLTSLKELKLQGNKRNKALRREVDLARAESKNRCRRWTRRWPSTSRRLRARWTRAEHAAGARGVHPGRSSWAARRRAPTFPGGAACPSRRCDLDELLPAGFVERTEGRRRPGLSHPAVGGFVTHCGWWNSTCAREPVARATYAEQHLNALKLVSVMGVAVPMEVDRKLERAVRSRMPQGPGGGS
ncbi:hypothetical protein EJB05_12765 [Eragrostis curvula]|uniref:Uncharacterized protein n=1 Tax=Eragrostis curvula TaxID=38414 RepID=A0A5J9VSF6_9POAL|nr:hypothetical protein EJB05_12765 [Eragrostis curvula]